MFRWFLSIVVVGTLGMTAPAAPRMVYMMEKGGGKAIVLADADGRNPKPLTHGPRWHLYPALDGSGRMVAYIEGPDPANLQVMTRDLNTGAVDQWTNRPGMHLHPRFSHDGRYLAFSGPYGPRNIARVAIVDLHQARGNSPGGLGETDPRPRARHDSTPEVIPSEFPCFFPALSSDGSLVVYQRSRGKHQKDIVLWNRANKTLTPVTDPDGESMAPALSFDDKLIAYTSRVHDRWDIYLRNLDGSRAPVQVTCGPGRNLAPQFRPDGSLVFASARTGRFQLYEISAAAMASQAFTARPLVEGDADFYAPSVSGEVNVVQKRLPELPTPARSSFGAVRLGNRVFVAGGHRGHEHTYPPESFLAGLMYFDLETARWHQAAPRAVPCHGFGLATVRKNVGGEEKSFIYAFGGFTYSKDHNPQWKSLDVIERYDVAQDRWEVIGHLPRPRSSNVVAQVGTKAYLIGGWDSTPRYNNDYEGHFHRHRLEAILDAPQHPVHSALGPAELGADLRGGVALQGQRHDVAVAAFQAAHQAFHRFGENGRLRRCRLAGHGLPARPGSVRCLPRPGLAADVAAGGAEMLDLMAALAQGDAGEQAPQPVPAIQFERPAGVAPEEALEHRLHHVLGVHLAAHDGVQPAAGQGDQPPGVVPEDAVGGVSVAGPQPGE
jgi:hypothetical protein